MRMLPFTRVALLRLLRDRTNAFFMLLFPLLIILLVGVQFGSGEPTPRIGVVQPPGSADLGLATDGRDVEVVAFDTVGDARRAVEDGGVEAAVVLPATAPDARGDETAPVRFIANPDGSDAAVRSIVAAAVAERNRDVRAVRALVASGLAFPEATDAVRSVGGAGPALTVTTVGEGGTSAEFAGLGQFDLGASTQLLLFVFITTMAGAVGVVQARRLRILDRVLAGPTAPGTVIGGLALAQLVVAGVQALLIVGASSLLFGVSWGDPVATTAVVLLFGAVAAAAGLLLGAAADNEEQVNGLAVPVSLGLGALGGCMVPLEVFPATLRSVARLTPHAWGNLAFAEIVRRDGGITDVVLELAVLAGFALVLAALAAFVLQRRLAAG